MKDGWLGLLQGVMAKADRRWQSHACSVEPPQQAGRHAMPTVRHLNTQWEGTGAHTQNKQNKMAMPADEKKVALPAGWQKNGVGEF